MDDTRQAAPVAPPSCLPVLAAAALCSLTGCSMFVMTGKMLFGNPRLPCAFRSATGINVADGEKKVVVVCSTPEAVKAEYPAAGFDLLEGVTQRLKREGVEVVSPDDVLTWIDNNGGDWGSPSELAERFQPDVIVHIKLERFTCREDNSPDMYRGRVNGVVVAYRVRTDDDGTHAERIFENDFLSVYPEHNPVAAGKKSARVFQQEYVGRVSAELARFFYDYHASETID